MPKIHKVQFIITSLLYHKYWCDLIVNTSTNSTFNMIIKGGAIIIMEKGRSSEQLFDAGAPHKDHS